MFRIVTAASIVALLAAQPAIAQDNTMAATATATAPTSAAPTPAKHMSFAEKLAIAAGVIAAGVVAVKALKGSSGQNTAAAAAPQPATQPVAH